MLALQSERPVGFAPQDAIRVNVPMVLVDLGDDIHWFEEPMDSAAAWRMVSTLNSAGARSNVIAVLVTVPVILPSARAVAEAVPCIDGLIAEPVRVSLRHESEPHAPPIDRPDNLSHLLALARQGQHETASGGEKRARRIVETLLEEAAGLDQRATAAVAELMEIIQTSPMAGTDKIKEAIQ